MKADIAPQIVAVGDETEIAQDFGLGRVFLRPFPRGLEFRIEGVAVVDGLNVAARAGIAVPVPGAADIVGLVEHQRREAGLAQPMQKIEAGKACAHHRDVDLLRRTAVRRVQSRCCDHCVWHVTPPMRFMAICFIVPEAIAASPVCHQRNAISGRGTGIFVLMRRLNMRHSAPHQMRDVLSAAMHGEGLPFDLKRRRTTKAQIIQRLTLHGRPFATAFLTWLNMGPERGLVRSAIRTTPVWRDPGKRCARSDRLIEQSRHRLVDEVAAAADEFLLFGFRPAKAAAREGRDDASGVATWAPTVSRPPSLAIR